MLQKVDMNWGEIRQSPMRWRMAIMLAVVGLVFGAIFGWQAFGRMMMRKGMASAPKPVQTVSAVKAETT